MKSGNPEFQLWRKAIALGFIGLLPFTGYAQDSSESDENEDNEIATLNPFEVTTSGDSRYFATNSIAGTRVDYRIQDIPISIEVITSEFIEDTGSVDLRESLRYSAGIVLQSQNDALSQPFSDTGGVHNPEGVTNNKTNTSIKIRGFVTDNVLRSGYRRQHATDAINIDRIEVVRGPNALLYGIGNFGGIVNYLAKRPLPEQRTELGFTVGSDEFYRFTVDNTGPMGDHFAYRITGALESTNHWTEIKDQQHWFISPVLEWRPFEKTRIIADFEFGAQEETGVSFQSVRAPTLGNFDVTQQDRLEVFGLLEFDGKDPRTFRWSGPDTFLNTDAMNMNLELQQELLPNLHLLAGYNYSQNKFESRDVFGSLNQNVGPTNLRGSYLSKRVVTGTEDPNPVQVDNAIFQYQWQDREEENKRDQVRVELNYRLNLFRGSDWLGSQNNFMLGFSWEELETETFARGTDSSGTDPIRDGWNWKSPTDASYIRFGTQGDGVADEPLTDRFRNITVASNTAWYGVYSGAWLNDRVHAIVGYRNDTASTSVDQVGFRPGEGTFNSSADGFEKGSWQFGLSVEPLKGVTLFGLTSEGLQPNFGGNIDGNGQPLDATTAESEELGIKLSLFENKLTLSGSVFKIEREGIPFSYWWAPAPARGAFDPNADIVYRMDDFNPLTKPDNVYLQAGLDEFIAAQNSGAVFEQNGLTYLNASTSQGAAYLNAVFDSLNAAYALPPGERPADAWPGWLYNGFDDPLVNTAAENWSVGEFFQSISDKSEGYEIQLMFAPMANWQNIITFSHVEREIVSPGNFVTHPFNEGNVDLWPMWRFPNGNWGLTGFAPEDVYLDPSDSGTWTGIGYGRGESLDDTPPYAISGWTSYDFIDGSLKGLRLGLGFNWEDKREFASEFTSAGQKKENPTENKIQAFTPERFQLNGMLRYEWLLRDRYNMAVQLNVDNILDDKDQYGLLYAPGRSWRFNLSTSF